MSTDTGTPWSIPYPEDTDEPDGPTQLGSIATTTASLLGKAYPCTSGARPSHTAGLLIYETDTDKLQVSDGSAWNLVWRDSGEISSGFTAQTDWTDTGCYYQILGSLVYVHIVMQYTGATLTTHGSTGNFADSGVVQLPSAIVHPSNYVWGSGTMTGTHHFTWRLRADNQNLVLVASWSLGVSLSSGDGITADFITAP